MIQIKNARKKSPTILLSCLLYSPDFQVIHLLSTYMTRHEWQEQAFEQAIQTQNFASIEQALDDGADINGLPLGGNSLLHRAVLINYSALIDFLLSKGADATLENHDGITPVYLALLHEHYASLCKLLAYRVPINCKALLLAYQKTDHTILLLLLEAGASPFMLMSKQNYLHTISSKEPHNKLIYAYQALCRAIKQGDIPAIGKLLNQGIRVPPQLQEKIEYLYSFVNAVISGTISDIRIFLVHGVPANTRANTGDPVLHIALLSSHAYTHKLALVQLLISRGADFTLTNNQGETAIHRVLQVPEMLYYIRTCLETQQDTQTYRSNNYTLCILL